MPSYTLDIEAFGVYSTDIPSLEIWADGVLDSTHSITSSGSTISVTISYGGSLPTSLSFTFNDALAEGGRTIEIQSVKINDKYVNTGNYLSSDSLLKSASATVDIVNSDFIFDASDPAASEFTPVTTALTAGGDTYRNYDGTDHVLDGLAGHDRIHLGSGADKVTGGAGNDRIFGGDGDDLLYGAGDNDKIEGQGGDDRLYGGTGNDRIHGGTGDDEIHGGAGNDKLNGHDDNDIITGGDGDDVLHGGNGIDYLFGDADNDKLVGGAGADTLDGGDGDDILYGGSGVDIIDGGDGDDILVGDTDNDVLNGGSGSDELHGGAGDDTLYADTASSQGTSVNSLSTEILADNPIVYYKMDETSGTTITNYGSLGATVNGTLSGTYTLDDTDQYLSSSSSIDFEGSSLLSIPNDAAINTSGPYNARTIEMVFTANSTTGRQVLFEEGGGSNTLVIYIDSGNLYFNGVDSGDWGPFTINTAITAGTTYHAALVLDQANSTLTGYLDGGVVGTGAITIGLSSHSGANGIGNVNGRTHFHDGKSASGTDYFFDGQISDFALYNSVVSSTDIQARADIVATSTTYTNTLVDGDGLDTLYGSDETDIFVFDSANAFNDVDEINYFSEAHGDALDISDLLIGFVLGTSDINDFVQLTESGGNTTIAIDANGTAGGSSYTDIAVINGVTGMDVDMMLTNETLIVA
ncbi:MAG: type I secretion C-terminal target domain-containing protein [Alphaproteobacteria bacterium]|nr:type I secretion C-terminal target domain-containing protein [Alphaproteobacteria bacterium]